MALRRGSTTREDRRGAATGSALAVAVRRGATVAAIASVGLLAACSGSSGSAGGGHGAGSSQNNVAAATSGQGGTGSGGTGSSGTGTGGTAGGGPVASGSAGQPGKITIALSPATGTDPFSVAMTIGAEAEARKLGVRVVWQASSQVYSAAAQVPIAGRLLAGHPSALVIAPTDPYALQPVVRQAVHGRIPVVNIDSHVAADVSRWLHAYPHLAGLFAIDATDATGAAQAVRARGLAGRLPLVGYDASAAEVTLLRRHVFAALIAQQPAAEGRLAVAAVVRYLRAGRSATGIARTVVLANVVLTPATPASVLARYTYPAG